MLRKTNNRFVTGFCISVDAVPIFGNGLFFAQSFMDLRGKR